jgi:hypothetical protein
MEHTRRVKSRKATQRSGSLDSRGPRQFALGAGPLGVADVLSLQRTVGNQAVQRLLQRAREEEPGRAQAQPVPIASESASPDLSNKNEFGEIDGVVQSGAKPHLFVAGGMARRGQVYWGGGDGGQGEQDVGSIDLTAPQYMFSKPKTPGGPSWVWIKQGTGTATVTRTWRGVVTGDNGTYYFTERAAERGDRHEELHVASSKQLHTRYIRPLEQRVASHTGRDHELKTDAQTSHDGKEALKAVIRWNQAVAGFATDDRAANVGGGTTDTTDMAQPDFIRNYGPKTVSGKDYASYMDVPPGP